MGGECGVGRTGNKHGSEQRRVIAKPGGEFPGSPGEGAWTNPRWMLWNLVYTSLRVYHH